VKRLTENDRAQRYRNDRIDVGVQGHDGDVQMLQRVGKRREADDRSDHHQVHECGRGARTEREPAPLADQRTCREHEQAAGDHLHSR
jgi:hypothetical protein